MTIDKHSHHFSDRPATSPAPDGSGPVDPRPRGHGPAVPQSGGDGSTGSRSGGHAPAASEPAGAEPVEADRDDGGGSQAVASPSDNPVGRVGPGASEVHGRGSDGREAHDRGPDGSGGPGGARPIGAVGRWVPRLLIATAVLHFGWAFAQPNAWMDIVRDGFVGTVVDTEADGYWPREASVWFMAAGVTLLALGTLTRHIVRTTGRVPAQLGWYLLLIGVPTAAISFPVTGSWALIGIGALALADRRSARESRDRS
ncbi:DUF6463 family protein [Streptomyces buecherae]|uniref:DUF6463 family protein n=1 Tax=Streptomyces buecherae TaxID=2763006 RepID=UPI001C27FF8E|nr:DUF6463 family protein [Streptomyces buecherae]